MGLMHNWNHVRVASARVVGWNADMNTTRPTSSRVALSSLITCVIFLAVFGCAAKPTAAPPPPDEPGVATAQDHASVAEFERLSAKLDGNRGTEVLNLMRDSSPIALSWCGLSADNAGPIALQRLAGKAPATKKQLDQARGVLALSLRRLQLLEKTAPAPSIDIVKKQGVIKIDGRLDESDWSRAVVVPMNHRFGPPEIQPDPANPSNARMLWDEDGLYVGYRVKDTDIHPGNRLRDDMTFLWDCAELFIVVDPQEPLYWEINVTPGGSFNDILSHKRPKLWAAAQELDATVDGLRHAVSVYGTPDDASDVDEGYVVEMFVPWKGLKGLKQPPRAGDEMRGLFAYGEMGSPIGYDKLAFYSDVRMVVGYQDVWNFRVWKFVERK